MTTAALNNRRIGAAPVPAPPSRTNDEQEAKKTCPVCLGAGEIDVRDPQTGWDTAPCPDCAPPDAAVDEPPF